MTSELPAWCAWWIGDKGATTNNQAAKTFRAMGEHSAAEQHHRHATTLWDPQVNRRVWALTSADAGLAKWRTGDQGGAVDVWTRVVPVLQEIQSDRTATMLGKIRCHAPDLVADDLNKRDGDGHSI